MEKLASRCSSGVSSYFHAFDERASFTQAEASKSSSSLPCLVVLAGALGAALAAFAVAGVAF